MRNPPASSPSARIPAAKIFPPRTRLWYGLATGGVIVLGLASRHYPLLFPASLGKYPGDALWALMVYFGVGFILPRANPIHVALLTAGCCILIETLKLYPAPWLVSLRHTTAGHLVFGQVFSWENFPAYAAGIAIGFLLEISVRAYCAKKTIDVVS